MDARQLNGLIAEHAALRRRQTLQPAGGKGDKIFPPTYPGEGRNATPRHVFERRRLDNQDVWCVLVDSVQSQANRLEECLLEAARDGLPVPYVTVDFADSGVAGLTQITSLDAPHRVYDAILRDSLTSDGTPFMKSALGERLAKAKASDASALLEASPNGLLFGAWHSTGEGGGIGAKFARCLTSEITGIGVPVDELVDQRSGEIEPRTAGRRTGSRIDPLGVLRKVDVYKGESGWGTTAAAAGKDAKKVRPSEINHGNIVLKWQALGVTCDRLEHCFVLSFAALRRLRFGGEAKDAAGRALLGALGLVALVEQDVRGYALRSRCDLVCDGRAPLELVLNDGKTEAITLGREAAASLYRDAFEAATCAGFQFPAAPVTLKPQDKLVEIVRKSQEFALAGAGGDDDTTDGAK